MLEKEQRYADALRSELAKCTDPSNEQQISRDLSGAKRRISTIQEQLQAMTANNNCTSSAQVANNGILDAQVRKKCFIYYIYRSLKIAFISFPNLYTRRTVVFE